MSIRKETRLLHYVFIVSFKRNGKNAHLLYSKKILKLFAVIKKLIL